VDARELEWHLVYSIVVAGKSATFANGVISRLREVVPPGTHPIRHLAAHPDLLREARSGRYAVIERALRGFVEDPPDLRRCGPERLERIPGIGPKTARFFVLWTRPEARHAVLDRHVLRWLRKLGHEAPENTPATPGVYRRLEEAFLAEARRRGLTPRELDWSIWSAAAKARNVVG